MPLFWIVRNVDGERQVYIREDTLAIYACVRGEMDGTLKGGHVESHMLDDRTANRIPKRSRNRMLTQAEAEKLLDRIGR